MALLLQLHARADLLPQARARAATARRRPDTLEAAKAGLEKKRLAAERQAQLAAELAALPPARGIRVAAPAHPLSRRTRTRSNTRRWKTAASGAGLSPLRADRALRRDPVDATTSTWRRFLLEYFPRGTGFADVGEPLDPPELPLSAVRGLLASTTRRPPRSTTRCRSSGATDGSMRVGIHIAAPALGIAPGSRARPRRARAAVHRLHARAARSPCCPTSADPAITPWAKTHDCPALSLYVDVASDLRVLGTETALEMVHDRRQPAPRHAGGAVQRRHPGNPAVPDYPYRRELECAARFRRRAGSRARQGRHGRPRRLQLQASTASRISIVPRTTRGTPDRQGRVRADDLRQRALGRLAGGEAACPASTARRPTARCA
ncbi:MAG: hypothetical protein MZV65_02140 [Chromatiales bacterium]|nr:hypothetical protein [Chromatiales bacterium]